MRRRIVIVGGGPAGLSLVRALGGSGVEITLLERQSRAELADPAVDGREIALTQASIRTLRRMGVWARIPADQAFPLNQARVLNGASPFALDIAAPRQQGEPLGALVSNHLIRRALFEAVADDPQLTLRCGVEVAHVRTGPDRAEVELAGGEVIPADLVVAADSRFSRARAAMGIGAEMLPIGRSMLVCRITHELPHDGIATEWFDHHRTVALLPLGPGMSSLVLTLPEAEAQRLAASPLADLAAPFAAMTHGRWGQVTAIGPAVAYPLTMTYARRFSTTRGVLLGDAAVGMHPVTAHGFNFGLAGADRLGRLLRGARDVGEARRLTRYALAHRAATWPLYLGTKALVRLFTDERLPARAARRAVLRLGALPPVRKALGSLLMDRGTRGG